MKKTILVTGAAGNLGRAVTQRLLLGGYHIKATLGPKDDPHFLQHDLLEALPLNLLDDQVVQNYVKGLDLSTVRALICLVGGYTEGSLAETNAEQIQGMIRINFESAYHMIHYLVGARQDQQSPLQVILIGARPAILPEDGHSHIAYGLSKSLLFTLAEYLNADTHKTGISASVIVPSTLDTPGTRAALPNADPSLWVHPERVADTIGFILSEAGQMMRQPIYKLYNRA